MKKQRIGIFLAASVLCLLFMACEAVATLFHGEKPEEPPVTYTVTFNGNGETAGTPPAAKTVTSGTVINLPDNTGNLSKGSDIFAGWSVSPNGGTIYQVLASVTVTENMIFYARWLDGSTPKYRVDFNSNGATGGSPPSAQEAYSGTSITIPNQGTLACSGKTFGGWNTLANGAGTPYAEGQPYTVTGDTTLYAKWQSEIQYTVTYYTNGASGTAPATQTVDPQTVITLPGQGSMTNIGKTFDGWNTQANGSGTKYAEGEEYTVSGDASFHAQWVSEPVTPQGATLAEQLAYIRNNAGDGIVYDIAVNTNEYMEPTTVATMGRNVTVNIHSASSADVKSIQLESAGHLFSVDNNITLKLQDIVLKGMSTNNKALVLVGQGGTLILNSGAKVTLNTNTGGDGVNIYYVIGHGGGILVNGGVLELNDGVEIIGNKVNADYAYGGGIYVENRGSVTIRGGQISENEANGGSYSVYNDAQGGGIHITGNSTVIMSGGTISKNISTNSRYRLGGGVFISSGSSFTKRAASGSSTSGIIYGGTGDNANTANSGGGDALYRGFGTLTQRNTTLGFYDEISTLSDEGWE